MKTQVHTHSSLLDTWLGVMESREVRLKAIVFSGFLKSCCIWMGDPKFLSVKRKTYSILPRPKGKSKWKLRWGWLCFRWKSVRLSLSTSLIQFAGLCKIKSGLEGHLWDGDVPKGWNWLNMDWLRQPCDILAGPLSWRARIGIWMLERSTKIAW